MLATPSWPRPQKPRPQNSNGAIGAWLLGIVAMVAVAVVGYSLYCPCERLPGGYLLGEAVVEPITDWGFANSVPLCQIQVASGLLPHSINLNCMSAQGELFLSCSQCEPKVWSQAALRNSQARLRVGDKVYPVHLARLLDPQRLDVAWLARAAKVGGPTDSVRPEHWWSFAVTSRR
jgi:hypothetical protein